MSEHNSSSGAFAFGLVVGVTAGAVAALLLTPRSGQDTIEQIRQRGRRLKRRVERLSGQTRQRIDDRTAQLQRLVQPHAGPQPASENPSEIDAEFTLDPLASTEGVGAIQGVSAPGPAETLD